MSVPILQQGRVLIASLQAEQSDADLRRLNEELLDGVARRRATGVILDVSAVEVMDSYAVRSLRTVSYAAGLCGARAVVVGIQPGVAYAMTQLGITLEGIATALDLDDGLIELRQDRDREPAEPR
ncbi:MAG: STAS domain-containing protein [Candidatus Dormiibacterota bacterium]